MPGLGPPDIPKPTEAGATPNQRGTASSTGQWIWNGSDWVWSPLDGKIVGTGEGSPTGNDASKAAQFAASDTGNDWDKFWSDAGHWLTNEPGKWAGSLPMQITNKAPGAEVDTNWADSQRQYLSNLVTQLQQQAATGDGKWRDTLDEATRRTQATDQALGQSRPGGNYASQLMNIGNAQSAAGQRAVGQGNQLREESKLAAQGQLGDLLGSMGQTDIEQANAVARARQQVGATNMALIDEAQKNAEGVHKGFETAASFMKFGVGGQVPGRPKVFGDDEANDTVPAMLSPGEVVLPRTVARDPAAAAAFVRAVNAGKTGRKATDFALAVKSGGFRKMADGGDPGYGYAPDAGDTYGSGNAALTVLAPSFGIPAGYNNLRKKAGAGAPTVENGGLLDLRQYGTDAGQRGTIRGDRAALEKMMMDRAAGDGPSVAPQQITNANDDAVAQALEAQNKGATAASVVGGGGELAQQGGGRAAGVSAEEQMRGQRALGNTATQGRAQELELALAQQQAGWNNTLQNVGLSLASQAQLRNMFAGAGQAAVAISGMKGLGGNGSGGGNKVDPAITQGIEDAFNSPDDPGSDPSSPDSSDPFGPGAEGDSSLFDNAGDYPDSGGDTQNAAFGGIIGMADGGKIARDKKAFAVAWQRANDKRAREASPMYVRTAADYPTPTAQELEHPIIAVAPNTLPASFVEAWKKGEAGKKVDRQFQAYNAARQEALANGDDWGAWMLEKQARDAKQKAALAAGDRPVMSAGELASETGRTLSDYAKRISGLLPDTGSEPVADAAYARGGRVGYADGGGVADSGPTFSYVNPDPLELPARRDNGPVVLTSDGASAPVVDPRRPVDPNIVIAPKAEPTLVQTGVAPNGLPLVEKRDAVMIPDIPGLEKKTKPPAMSTEPVSVAPVIEKKVGGAPPGDALALKETKDAAHAQYDASAAEANAKVDAAAAELNAIERHVAERKALMLKNQQRVDEARNRFESMMSEASKIDTTVDPGRYWAAQSTGQKIMGILGLVLGAIGSGPDGINRAAVMMNQAIDRDIDAQKAEHELRLRKGQQALEGARTYYSMARDVSNDESSALDLAHAAALQGVAANAKMLLAKTENPQAQARLKAMIALADQGAADRKAKWNEKETEFGIEREKNQIEREKIAAMAGAQRGSTQAKLADSEAATQTALDTIGTMRNLLKGTRAIGQAAPLGAQTVVTGVAQKVGPLASKLEASTAQLLTQIKETENLGAISGSDAELLRAQIGDPQAFWASEGSKDAKLDAIEQQLRSAIENKRRAAQGAQAK